MKNLDFEFHFSKHKYITKQQLVNVGYTDYDIKTLLQQGYIERLKNGVYYNLVFQGFYNELYCVGTHMQKGVVCLLSAAFHHGLIQDSPSAIQVAIDLKRKKAVLPDKPKFEYFMFDLTRLNTGVVEVRDEIGMFRVYDEEKTLCDLVFYRNKLGVQYMKEALTTYLNRSDRNIEKLMAYAKILRAYNQLNTYLSVLL